MVEYSRWLTILGNICIERLARWSLPTNLFVHVCHLLECVDLCSQCCLSGDIRLCWWRAFSLMISRFVCSSPYAIVTAVNWMPQFCELPLIHNSSYSEASNTISRYKHELIVNNNCVFNNLLDSSQFVCISFVHTHKFCLLHSVLLFFRPTVLSIIGSFDQAVALRIWALQSNITTHTFYQDGGHGIQVMNSERQDTPDRWN